MKQKFVLPFVVKQVTDEGTFSGMASVYGVTDLGGDVVERGAFTKTLAENPTVPILWHHKSEEVIGSGALRNTREGLAVDGTLDMEDPVAQKAHRKLKLGLMKGLSIGFETVVDEIKNGVRHLKEIKLWEVSIVTFPMLPVAQVTSVKDAVLSHKADFNTELDAVQTVAKRYMMITALDEALSSIIWGNSATEDKMTAAEDSINQFANSFLEFLPQYLALMDSRYKSAVELFESKEGVELVAAHRAQIDAATKQFLALLTTKAANPGTSSESAAVPAADAGNQSAILSQINLLKESFQWTPLNSN